MCREKRGRACGDVKRCQSAVLSLAKGEESEQSVANGGPQQGACSGVT